ncbi:transglutaminase-like cysteine peptidase [Thioalkalivibrio sp. ALJT]|uniref:transglutaminase-like cysteine peptidase n=1 Tax=Thioalkalivibrio sp. ALJT TaxID=1158146 RepID=UPI0004777B4B|nr:transglutaminase-like cysteine peptidase [Thioalkalivibrio sp. ALJT]
MFALLAGVWWLSSSHASPDNPGQLEQIAAERYGPETAERVRGWRALLEALASEDEQTQIARVNEFFNRQLQYQDDRITWGQEDFWATPLEALDKGAGDCEDFSIAKYVSLRKLGIPDERLRLFYVRARLGGPESNLSQAHMVLGYFTDPHEEPLILDNLVTRIERASRRDDLTPVFSFNSQGLWPDGHAQSAADPTARLSRWRRVLEQLDEYGLDLDPPIHSTPE